MNDPVLQLFIIAMFFVSGVASMFLGAFFKWAFTKLVRKKDELL